MSTIPLLYFVGLPVRYYFSHPGINLSLFFPPDIVIREIYSEGAVLGVGCQLGWWYFNLNCLEGQQQQIFWCWESKVFHKTNLKFQILTPPSVLPF